MNFSDTSHTRYWVLAGLVCYVYGRLICLVPSPDDPATFWVANLAAPFAVVAFLAGRWCLKILSALVAGALMSALMVAGFYRFDSVGIGLDASQFELPLDTGPVALVVHAYAQWLETLTVGNLPWLSIALVTGAIFGVLGSLLRSGRELFALFAGSLFVAEGLLHIIGFSFYGNYASSPFNISIWITEVVIGVGVAFALSRIPGNEAHSSRVR